MYCVKHHIAQLVLRQYRHADIILIFENSTIKIAPAYHTRRQDGVFYPTTETFNKAYNIIQLSSLPSKTKETSFQILNNWCLITMKLGKFNTQT
jgi:hypothetical protein